METSDVILVLRKSLPPKDKYPKLREAMEYAIGFMGKDMPIKAVYKKIQGMEYGLPMCPLCNNLVDAHHYEGSKPEDENYNQHEKFFCGSCGQALYIKKEKVE